MQITVSGHHIEVTPALRAATRNKITKLQRYFPEVQSVNAYLTVEKHEHRVEMVTQYLGTSIAVNGKASDLYLAIKQAAKKLDAALQHRKGNIRSHGKGEALRFRKVRPTEETVSAPDELSYDDVAGFY